MIKWISGGVALLALIALGAVDFSEEAELRYAQDAPVDIEVDSDGHEPGEKPVTEAELQLYIEVYKAMQSDHSLKVDDIVAARGMTVSDFRQVERRIQSKSTLVERVRTALLEHAKQQPVLALQPPAHTTPEITPASR